MPAMSWLAAARATEGFGVGLVVSAFLFGFRHGIDWDHIAAITDITSSQEEQRQSVLFGTLYALGHALVVFLIGSAAILLGDQFPDSIDPVMTRIVGATLLILGVYVFVALVRHGREFRMRSRWMLIFTGVRNAYRRLRPSTRPDREPVHMHVGGSGSIAVDVAEDIPVSEWHHGHHGRPGHHHHDHPEPDAFMNYGKRTSFAVGMVHGIGAETPTQLLIFVTVAGVGGPAVGEVLLGTFLLGLLASNTLITLGSAFGYMRASKNWTLYVSVAVLTAVFSLVIGTLFLLGKESLLPGVFG
jgi:ABC-type nickel/cobalt efflux system permease component RcnA